MNGLLRKGMAAEGWDVIEAWGPEVVAVIVVPKAWVDLMENMAARTNVAKSRNEYRIL